MKLGKILTSIWVMFGLIVFLMSAPVYAADAAAGAKVFAANCAQCHRGGLNIVVKNKTLKKEALESYGMYSAEAIIYQVTNGKNGMPAFGTRLKPEQIENVTAYVLSQAEKGWQ